MHTDEKFDLNKICNNDFSDILKMIENDDDWKKNQCYCVRPFTQFTMTVSHISYDKPYGIFYF